MSSISIDWNVSNHEGCPTHKSKVKVQAFLASMLRVVNELGKGAQKKYWNFDSTELGEFN